jgi:hypothetical protein
MVNIKNFKPSGYKPGGFLYALNAQNSQFGLWGRGMPPKKVRRNHEFFKN